MPKSRRASGTPPRLRARRVRSTCGPQLPTAPKARGELAEARFLAKAMSFGLVVNKPFGDSARYDFVVDAAGRLSRVQVKSAWSRTRTCRCYIINTCPSQRRGESFRPYGREDIDFLAAYIAPEDTWFIMPVESIPATKAITLSMRPNRRRAEYREAWGLLADPRRRRASARSARKNVSPS